MQHLRLFTLTLLSLGAATAHAKILLDRVVAVVSDEPILQSEIDSFRRQIQTSPAMSQIYRIDAKTVNDQTVLDRMIEDRIVRAALKEMDLSVAESEVDTQIGNVMKQSHLDEDQLKASLASEGIPYAAYRDNLRTQLERRNIFDRELRRGGGISEADLREAYDAKAQPELDIVALTLKDAKTAEAFKAGQMSTDELLKNPNEDLGWLAPASLDAKVAAALAKAGPNDLRGPVKLGGKLRWLYVRNARKGSDEEFEKMKGSLQQDVQSKDFEKRFAAWLDRKKSEFQILINPL